MPYLSSFRFCAWSCLEFLIIEKIRDKDSIGDLDGWQDTKVLLSQEKNVIHVFIFDFRGAFKWEINTRKLLFGPSYLLRKLQVCNLQTQNYFILALVLTSCLIYDATKM